MKKNFKAYAIAWISLIAVFNVICFASPAEAAGMNKFGGAFWAGYIFITLAFVGQIICACIAFKAENLKKLFYNLPLITVSYTGLIFTVVFGVLCMAIPDLPNWIGIVVCLLILTFTAIAIIKAGAATEIVSAVDGRVTDQTSFIKTLEIDAQCLYSAARSKELKTESMKVLDAIRYSDPMSNNALADAEALIRKRFSEFSAAVEREDAEPAKVAGQALIEAIKNRNSLCKKYK